MVREHGHQPQQPDPLSGLPLTLDSPLTEEGFIEQVGKIASGLRGHRRGWRRIVFLAGASVIVIIVLVAVLSAVTSH